MERKGTGSMIRRETWIVVGIFVLVLAVAMYLNQNPLPGGASATPSATETPALLAGWSDADIVWMEYRGAPGTLSLAQNPDGSWTLGPDDPAPASIGQVEYLRSQLTALRVTSVLNTTDPLDAVGLTAPEKVLAVRNSEGRQVEIRIGNATPTGSGYYIQLDSQTPVVVSKFAVDGLLEALTREKLLAPTATPPVTLTPNGTPAPEPTPGLTNTPQK